MKIFIYTLLALVLLGFNPAQSTAQKAKNINVSVSEEDGYKKITIKKTLEDGTIDVTNWEGTGEIPAEIKKEMEQGGAVFIEMKGGEFQFHSKDSAQIHKKTNNVFIHKIGEHQNDVEKEVEVIVERLGDGQEFITEEEVKIIVIEDGKEVEWKKDDMDIQIQEIHEEQGNKTIKVIVEENDEKVSNQTQKIIIVKGKQAQVVEVKTAAEQTNENKMAETRPISTMERSLKLKDFQLSPNPASERINLSFKGKKDPITIKLLGVDGRQFYKEYIRDFDGFYQKDIDLKEVQSNFIIVTIEQKGKVYTDKVAIVK